MNAHERVQIDIGGPLLTTLLTVREIEDTLNLGHTKTAELIRTGEIETLKIGSRRLTTPEALDKFIQRKLKEQAA